MKPAYLHSGLFCLLAAYGVIGGAIFYKIEAQVNLDSLKEEDMRIRQCVRKHLTACRSCSPEQLAEHVMTCFEEFLESRQKWSFSGAIVYAIAVMITAGGKYELRTDTGRVFAICFAICGIPVALTFLANVGKFVTEVIEWARKRMAGEREKHRFIFVGGFLSFCALYVIVAALFIARGGATFVAGFYDVAMSLIAIDMFASASEDLLAISLATLYVTFGLAIVTIGIDMLSDYVKKLHFYGKKLANALSTKVWFGGTDMTVETLTLRITESCEVPEEIAQRCLDNFDSICLGEYTVPKDEEPVDEDEVSVGEMADESGTPSVVSVAEEIQPLQAAEESVEPEKARIPAYQDVGPDGFKHLFNIP